MVKFDRTKKFTKTNIQKLPDDKAVIYKIKNASGNNLYTGIAGRGRVVERLLEHKNIKKEVIPGGTHIQIAQVKTKEIAEKDEVGKKIKRILKLKKTPKLDDTVDALAVAIAHTLSNGAHTNKPYQKPVKSGNKKKD